MKSDSPESGNRLARMLASRPLRRGLLIWLLAFTFTELSFQLGWLNLAEHIYGDQWHRLAGVRHQPAHVALVVIDDQALLERNDIPLAFWTPYYAEASRILREVGVKAIGLDLLLGVSPESWLHKLNLPESDVSRTYDVSFRRETNTGKIVLAGAKITNYNRGHDDFQLPHADYLLAIPDFDLTAHIGLADLIQDSDTIVRSFVTAPVIRESPEMATQNLPRLTISTLLAVKATAQDPTQKQWRFGDSTIPADASPRSIGYVGPPGTILRVSLSRLLAPNADKDPIVRSLKDKVVIIGGEFQGMNDLHATPYSTGFRNSGTWMTGPEVQANIVETLLSGTANQPLPALSRVLYFGMILLVVALLLPRFTPLAGFAAFIIAALAIAALGFFGFSHYLQVPVANMQFGLLVSYICSVGIRLSAEERERARITRIFGQYVSDQVVDDIVKSNSMPALGGESVSVSVLFSDIRDFTTACEKLTASEVVEMLNEYLTRACEPILEYGGSVDKFIGDAIMAEFGSTYQYPDHALRAVRAALRMQQIAVEFADWLKRRFPGRDLPDFQIGVGIHTGEAVVGNIGTPKKKNFTTIGDTVNVASRLESMTKTLACDILISKETLCATGFAIETGKHEIINVKGRAQSVEVFEALKFNHQGAST